MKTTETSPVRGILGAGAVLLLALLVWSCAFQVQENEVVIVARLGDPSRVVDEPGLAWKLPPPFDTLFRVDERVRVLDSESVEYLTADKKNILVSCFVAWRVEDPVRFVASARDLEAAGERVGDIALSELGNLLGTYALDDLVRVPEEGADAAGPVDGLADLNAELTAKIAARAEADFGIAVEAARVKRLNYPRQNKQAVFRRMEAERQQIAQEIRSQGLEEAERVRADAAKEAALLLNEAARRSEELRGEGEAEAMRIYGEAYGRDPEFYEFTRTLEAYGTIFGERSTFVIPEDSELLRVLRSVPDAERTLPPERGAGDPSSDG